eukprot:363288-Chlamydomonas_euryale.AAC.5
MPFRPEEDQIVKAAWSGPGRGDDFTWVCFRQTRQYVRGSDCTKGTPAGQHWVSKDACDKKHPHACAGTEAQGSLTDLLRASRAPVTRVMHVDAPRGQVEERQTTGARARLLR